MAFWDEEIERIDRKSLEKLQLKRLRRMVGRAANTTYYSKIFDRQDIRADKIESLSMIRALPFTTKEDLRSSAHEDFLAVPKEEVVRIHVSSGTTGAPTAIYHSATDLDSWAGLVARCLCMAGFTRSDVFQNMTGYGPVHRRPGTALWRREAWGPGYSGGHGKYEAPGAFDENIRHDRDPHYSQLCPETV